MQYPIKSLSRKISQNHPKTKRELPQTVIKVWNNEIPKEFLQNLDDSMLKSVAAMVKAKAVQQHIKHF